MAYVLKMWEFWATRSQKKHGLINSVGRARILLPCADVKKKKKSIAVNVCLWQGKDDLKC